VAPLRVTGHDAALAWFDAERAALVALAGTAARAGWHPQVWHLAWALVDFFDRRAHWHDWAATQTLAVHAAGELDHPAGRAVAHRGVATAYVRLRRYDDAETHFRLALDLFRTAGDAAGEVDVHFDLCAVSEGRGQIRQALGHAREAVDRYRAAGNRRGAAQALNALGWYHGQVAEFDHMLAHCREALALLQSLGDRHGQAESWGNIGYAQHHLGRHGGAAAAYRPALDLFDEVGDRYGRAWVLTHLGDAQLAGGDPAAARAAWSAALAILDELGHAEADDVRVRLSALPDAGVTAAAVTS
jgi:tetratricopeptide (TPR) repeat protein